jgi:hypothetical protein
MLSGLAALLLSGVALLNVQAQSIPVTDLVGTWSSKSNSTLTGDVRTTNTRAKEDAVLITDTGLLRPPEREAH